MTPQQFNELLKKPAIKRRNPDCGEGLCADNSEPTKRSPLVGSPQREETRWYGSARRFEITFRVYSTRPCDWDGYSIKQLQDMVVHAGIIPDDGWKVLAGRADSRKAHTKAEERTEILIKIVDTQPQPKTPQVS